MLVGTLLVLAGMVVLGVRGLTEEDQTGKCSAYAYCQGERFPKTVILKGRTIQCDQVPSPTKNCCLPSNRHLVCYNIQITGSFLNIHRDNSFVSTDFEQLCSAMLHKLKRVPGKHSAVTFVPSGDAHIIYRQNNWSRVDTSSERIKDLACEVRN